MTPQNQTIVRNVFKHYYSDFGVYRWMNRNKSGLFKLFGWSFLAFLILAFAKFYPPLIVWNIVTFSLIVAGAIDHMRISNKIAKILRILNEKKISITKPELLDICKDILPT